MDNDFQVFTLLLNYLLTKQYKCEEWGFLTPPLKIFGSDLFLVEKEKGFKQQTCSALLQYVMLLSVDLSSIHLTVNFKLSQNWTFWKSFFIYSFVLFTITNSIYFEYLIYN